MYKLGRFTDGDWREHSHPPVFEIETREGGSPRVVATVPGGDPLIFLALASQISPPFYLLYVLHTPRGEGEPGRYQSEAMSRAEIAAFVERFRALLTTDARFDLWLHSPSDNATIVWDRHDMIHGYGPVDRMATALGTLGFSEEPPSIPSPHEHHYHPENDAAAGALLKDQQWIRSPLRPEDEQ